MAFTLDPQTEKITFGVVSDGTQDGIARDIAQEFGVSETFNDDFVTATNWTQTATKISVNTGNQNVDWDALRDGTNHAISHDLGAGNVSDTKWVLRFKWTPTVLTSPTTDPNIMHITLSASDDSVASNVVQDHVAIFFQAETSPNLRKAFIEAGTGSLNAPTDVPFSDDLWSVGTPVFVELKRTSATSYEASLFSDSTYSVLIQNITSTSIDASVNALRYIKIQNRTQFATEGLFDGTIDDVQFWNGITVPVITSNNWRLRFKLDVTNLDDGANSIDKRLYMLMTDEDEVSGSNNAQDSLGLLLRHDGGISNFSIIDTNGTAPTNATADSTFATAPSASTFFVEIRRTSSSLYEASLFPDNTFTTPTETEIGSVMVNTVELKYLKFMNEETLTGAGAIDGTIDDITFDDIEAIVGVETDKTFTVDALVKGTCGNIIFQDDFTTNANWTQVSTGVSVTGGEIQGWGADASTRKVFHDLVTPVDDNGWKAEFECEFSFFSTFFFGPAHDIFGLSNTTASGSTLQDWIGVRLTGSGNPGGTNNFQIIISDGAPVNAVFATNPTLAFTGVRYFVRLERLSLTEVKMSIFTGGFDVTPFGTPTTGTIPSTITGLRVITSANNIFGNSARVLTGVLDNLIIFSGTFGCPTFTVDGLIQSTGDVRCVGTPLILFDPIGGNSGLWTEVDGAGEIEIDLAGSGVLEWNTLRGGATNTETFAHRQIPNFADNLGEIRMRVKVTKIADSGGITPTGRFMVLQNNALHPRPSTGSQMQLGIGNNGANGGIFVLVGDGTTNVTPAQINFVNGTTRFIEGIYDPVGQTLTLNVFTDADFTVHEVGSPKVIDASAISMTGLIFTHMITSNVKNSGPARAITADLDDFQIGGTNTCPLPQIDALVQILDVEFDFTVDAITLNRFDKEFTVDGLIQILGDNGFCLGAYMNDMSSPSEWVSTDTTPSFGSQGFFDVSGGVMLVDPIADNTNDTISIDLSDPSRLGGDLPDSGGWRMRCTLKYIGFNIGGSNHMFIGLSNFQSVNYGAGVEDAIMIRFQGDGAQNPTAPRWIPDFKNSLTAPDISEPVGRTTNLFTAGVTYGVEIRRDRHFIQMEHLTQY